MSLHDGTIVFLTDASDVSLSAMPGIAALADELDCRLEAVCLDTRRDTKPPLREDQRTYFAGRVLAAFPRNRRPGSIELVPPKNLAAALVQAATPAVAEHALAAGSSGSYDVSAAAPRPAGFIAMVPAPGLLASMLNGKLYDRLLRGGPLPFLHIPRHTALDSIRRVLFPADLSTRSDPALDATIELCRSLAAELHILHVFGPDRRPPVEQDTVRRAAAKNPLELYRVDKDRLASLVDRAASRNVRTIAKELEGRAHDRILRYAGEQHINLIVMPSHGARSISDVVFGSTSRHVLKRARLPVLVMRGGPFVPYP